MKKLAILLVGIFSLTFLMTILPSTEYGKINISASSLSSVIKKRYKLMVANLMTRIVGLISMVFGLMRT